MLINLSDVLSEPHKTIEDNVVPEMKQVSIGGRTFPVDRISPLHIRIEYAGDKKLHITGGSSLTVIIPCDRCLEDVAVDLDLEIEKNVKYYVTDVTGLRHRCKLHKIIKNKNDWKTQVLRYPK